MHSSKNKCQSVPAVLSLISQLFRLSIMVIVSTVIIGPECSTSEPVSCDQGEEFGKAQVAKWGLLPLPLTGSSRFLLTRQDRLRTDQPCMWLPLSWVCMHGHAQAYSVFQKLICFCHCPYQIHLTSCLRVSFLWIGKGLSHLAKQWGWHSGFFFFVFFGVQVALRESKTCCSLQFGGMGRSLVPISFFSSLSVSWWPSLVVIDSIEVV